MLFFIKSLSNENIDLSKIFLIIKILILFQKVNLELSGKMINYVKIGLNQKKVYYINFFGIFIFKLSDSSKIWR